MKKAFTLIELLVVISIIGVLATLLLANFNSTRSRARDAQRKSDLRNIQTALRLYYNDCGKYPAASSQKIKGCGTCVAESPCEWGGTFARSDGTVYMSLLPDDPLPDVNYTYTGGGGDSYSLIACLENKSDDKCDKPLVYCGTDNYGCQYTVKP